METTIPPPKTRMKALFAVVAIALLLVGLGAGYLLGRPVPAAIPGPVSGLLRTMIPQVDGWFRNGSVSYLDFGPQSNVAVPILAFFQATSPSTPVAGQRNIIDTIPSQPGYSDFWRVYKVLVPDGYVANSIRSLGDAVASGYTIQETNTIVNCPVVSSATTPSLAGPCVRPADPRERGLASAPLVPPRRYPRRPQSRTNHRGPACAAAEREPAWKRFGSRLSHDPASFAPPRAQRPPKATRRAGLCRPVLPLRIPRSELPDLRGGPSQATAVQGWIRMTTDISISPVAVPERAGP